MMSLNQKNKTEAKYNKIKKSELIKELTAKAHTIRKNIAKVIYESKTAGHIGGSLSCVEILTVLFFYAMHHRPKNPAWEKRDRFILSKGHAAPALYAVLAEIGYFSKYHLWTFKKLGSILQGHPDMKLTPGVEMSTGSLGQGLSVAMGMALAGKLDRKLYKVYVLLGDGEIEEGSVWEAAMAISNYNLDNVIAFIDRNNLQISGKTEEIMHLEPLSQKWKAFGWNVLVVDGHKIKGLVEAIDRAKGVVGKPSVIIAKTIKGKGIPSLENKLISHSYSLNKEELVKILEN